MQTQLNLATKAALGIEESGRCRKGAVLREV